VNETSSHCGKRHEICGFSISQKNVGRNLWVLTVHFIALQTLQLCLEPSSLQNFNNHGPSKDACRDDDCNHEKPDRDVPEEGE